MKDWRLWLGVFLISAGIGSLAGVVTVKRSPFTPGQWECYKAGTLEHVTFIVPAH